MTNTTEIQPEEIEPTYLAFSWSVSRGRETYGYNIMTVTDQNTGKRFRCNGGGYDMTGTSVGNWMEATYPKRLQAVAERADIRYFTPAREPWYEHSMAADRLYGMTVTGGGGVRLDGACGLESMLKVAHAIGLKLERTYKATGRNRGETTGYIVTAA